MKEYRGKGRVRVIEIDSVNQRVTLDTVFSATLDKGEHNFEKHFTKLYWVKNPNIIDRLKKEAPEGSVIEATILNDYDTFEMSLENFEVIEVHA